MSGHGLLGSCYMFAELLESIALCLIQYFQPLLLGISSQYYTIVCKTDSQWNLLYDSGNSTQASVTA